ncbi:tRNA pseudouridine(55) synthase TruB [Erysipelatoclostridium sp. An173]|uniref:tRNA pseudouridine(55) synthase TruB n=1 Tax=unclassified Thomasclavelia TaxID=3025756 RepID=UPI000B375A5B|nr:MULTISPECIES: tRNA pseudouridine(55) synthase TruB [unclassified Thomasclavelia]OUP79116.1 tRNA pseudouridine(55) synthase TruB [Erysipelatoclostridium sp. An173]
MDGVIIVNKPAGMTSHDVVNRIRKIFKTKKVGHCGTLDPDATGVLVVAVNKATKLLQFLTADNKEYIATLSLGTATDTYDASGQVTATKEYVPISDKKILACLNSFVGKQEQIPPMHSAIKVKGKKLYEYARNNETVEIPRRVITIDYIELISIVDNLVKFKVGCSKGTYIRSLCFDIAKKLDYPGHMYSLIRSKSGNFSLSDSYSLEEIENGEFEMLSMEEALSNYPKLVVDDENIIYHGKKIKSKINHQVAIYNQNNKVLAIYGPDGNGYLKNIRGLW